MPRLWCGDGRGPSFLRRLLGRIALSGPALVRRLPRPSAYDRGAGALCGACHQTPPRHAGVRAAVAYGDVARTVALRLQIWRAHCLCRDGRAADGAADAGRRRPAGAGAAASLAYLVARLQPGRADRARADPRHRRARTIRCCCARTSVRRRRCAAWARGAGQRRSPAPSAFAPDGKDRAARARRWC